jgi:hypothetical protein
MADDLVNVAGWSIAVIAADAPVEVGLRHADVLMGDR